MTSAWLGQRALAQLRRRCSGRVIDRHTELAPFGRDFGGMCTGSPVGALVADDERDVVAALTVAAEQGLPLHTRGAGHSQSGQALGGGLVLDMTRLNRVVTFAADAEHVEVEAGCTWANLMATTFPHGLVPVGLTHALDTTVGGTLSVAGVGAESFRTGPQVDNVLYLDVATLDGLVVRCSPDRNRELFEAVRSGLGQCGVIVRVGYPLRRCKTAISVRRLAYLDRARFLRDVLRLAEQQHPGRWLTSNTLEHPFEKGRCVFSLLVGEETNPDGPPSSVALPDLDADFDVPARTCPMWTSTGNPGHGFFQVFGAGQEPTLNPWVEYVFGLEQAGAALEAMASELQADAMRVKGGAFLLRRGTTPAPLFVVPEGDLLLGLGFFPTLPPDAREAADALSERYVARFRALSGKRYLSGYFGGADQAAWTAHFGAAWSLFTKAKAQHDPRALLNPGFLPLA